MSPAQIQNSAVVKGMQLSRLSHIFVFYLDQFLLTTIFFISQPPPVLAALLCKCFTYMHTINNMFNPTVMTDLLRWSTLRSKWRLNSPFDRRHEYLRNAIYSHFIKSIFSNNTTSQYLFSLRPVQSFFPTDSNAALLCLLFCLLWWFSRIKSTCFIHTSTGFKLASCLIVLFFFFGRVSGDVEGNLGIGGNPVT